MTKYTVKTMQKKQETDEQLKYLFFWGHTPAKNGEITKSCLSQWWASEFEIDGINYRSAEQFMMAEKARIFNDNKTRDLILSSTHPKQAKDLGRKVMGFDEEIWRNERYNIVKRGNFAKFSQDERLKEFLLQTGNRVLVEASPVDKIWGIGMAVDDKNVENPHMWRGLNLLGFALMDVRDELLEELG